MGKGANAKGCHLSQKPAVTSPDTSTREMNFVLSVVAIAHDHANLVPAERGRVLDAYCLTDAQLGKGSGVLVIGV